MRKVAVKILKYLLGTLLILVLLVVLLVGGFYFYLKTSSGEHWLTQRATAFLTKETGDEVSIGRVVLDLPNTVQLYNVVVRDGHQNVMFNIRQAGLVFGYYNTLSHKITFNKATIDGLDFNLIMYKGDSNSNFMYVIKRLAGTDTTKVNKTDILFKSISLNRVNFNWNNYNNDSTHQGIDWDHLAVKDMNGRFTYFYVKGDEIGGTVRSMNFRESSGFEVTDLQTRYIYNPKYMEMNSLYLKTPHTELANYLRFDYHDVSNFSTFIDSVQMTSHLINSTASFKDIAYFTNVLQDKTEQAFIYSSDVKGPVANMHVSNVNITYGDISHLRGKVSLKGLPNLEETFMDVYLKDSRTSKKEIERLMPEAALPKEIDLLGEIDMNGRFTGFINDFVAYGSLNTALGRIKSDLNLKMAKNAANSSYSGKLQLENFDIAALIPGQKLGRVSMNGTVSGKGLTLQSMHARLDAGFQRFDYNDYAYTGIKVNGNIDRKLFLGFLAVNDPNLDMNFYGSVNYNTPKPAFDFVSAIRFADLHSLHFSRDSIALETMISINVQGSTPDDIEGNITAHKTRFIRPDRTYLLDTLSLSSSIQPGHRSILLKTDIGTASLSGDFMVSRLPDISKMTLDRYIDSSFLRLKTKDVTNQHVDFDIHIKDPSLVFSLLKVDAGIADSSYLHGSLAADNGKLELKGYFPSARYKRLSVRRLSLDGEGDGQTLTLLTRADSLVNKDSVLLTGIQVRTLSSNDHVKFGIMASDELKQKSVSLNGKLDVHRNIGYLNIDSSTLFVLDTAWSIAGKDIVMYSDTMIDVPLLSFTNGKQQLKISGKYGAHHSYPIRAVVENLGLRMLTAFSPEFASFRGELNGQAVLNGVHEKPTVDAGLFVSPILYQTDTLGTFQITANYEENTGVLNLIARLTDENQNVTLGANGSAEIYGKRAIDFDIALNKTRLQIFEPFISEIFSNLTGEATATVKVTGTAKEPFIKGNILLDNAAFTVNYTNARYRVSHVFKLDGHVINIRDARLYDINNRQATVNGTIDLKHPTDMVFDLAINASNFQVLNTTQKNNSLYYGEGFGTGLVTIKGTAEDMKMYIKLRTEKNTHFSLPITQGSSTGGQDYIRFIDKKKYLKNERSVKISGLQLNMDLEITPDAFAEIIFDPRIGDILEGRGQGNIKLDINTEGDFSMYGVFTLVKGDYRFTAHDIINKSFSLKPGSTLTWTGSPYDAQLDVQAAYKVRTSLLPFAPTSLSEQDKLEFSKTYPVEALLYLRGPLFQPEIKLDFDVQMTTTGAQFSNVQEKIRQIKADEQEVNRQVAGLLALNQFLPVNEGLTGNTSLSSAYTGIGDLVSNQVNYWLSQYLENVQVGVDYKPEQYATFRISAEVLNNRASANASYDPVRNNHNLEIGYKLSPDGNTRTTVFSRSNNNPSYYQTSNTIGVGLYFRREFDKFSDLFKRKNKKQQKAK